MWVVVTDLVHIAGTPARAVYGTAKPRCGSSRSRSAASWGRSPRRICTRCASTRAPYVEFVDHGAPTYVEHHRTFGDRVREIVAAGFRLVDVVEPEWPAGLTDEWEQWSPLLGAIFPETSIYVCELPGDRP